MLQSARGGDNSVCMYEKVQVSGPNISKSSIQFCNVGGIIFPGQIVSAPVLKFS